jgi:hypothetical protein
VRRQGLRVPTPPRSRPPTTAPSTRSAPTSSSMSFSERSPRGTSSMPPAPTQC